MKKLLNFVLLFVVLALAVEITQAQTSTYILTKDIKAGDLAKELGIDFKLLKEANPAVIKTSATKLKKDKSIKLPEREFNFYKHIYLLKIGYTTFWNQELAGSMFCGYAEYFPDFAPFKLGTKFNWGPYVSVKGGGLKTKNGYYQGPGGAWSAGIIGEFLLPGVNYRVWFGYYQQKVYSEFATGLMQPQSGHAWIAGVEFHPFKNRFLKQSPWFNDAMIYGEIKIPTRDDELFLPQPDNPLLRTHEIKLGTEIPVFDFSLGQAVILPVGLEANASIFGKRYKKSSWLAGVFVEALWNKRQVGRLYFDCQDGISGVNGQYWRLGINLNIDAPLDRNEPKFR